MLTISAFLKEKIEALARINVFLVELSYYLRGIIQ